MDFPPTTGTAPQVRPPTTLTFRPPTFVYPPGASPLEHLLSHPHLTAALIQHLPTPALLSLLCTSRAARTTLSHHPRAFTTLVLLPDAAAARWHPPGHHDADDGDFPWRAAVDDAAPTRRVKITAHERRLLVAVCLAPFVDGVDSLQRLLVGTAVGCAQVGWLRAPRPRREYIEGLRSRHLFWLVRSLPLPVGRGLAGLVLDGTAVETAHMKLFLRGVEGTLAGLSVRACPNLECWLWAEWWLEGIEAGRRIALRWICIWGSGNTPNHTFDLTLPPDALEPLPPHPDDPPLPATPDPDPATWSPRPSPFANLLPLRFHLTHTLPLLPAMNLARGPRAAGTNELVRTIQAQYRGRRQGQGGWWFAPAYPLGEPHPLVAFMAVARFLGVATDVALCVARERCFSFVEGARPRLGGADVARGARVLVVDPRTGGMVPCCYAAGEEDGGVRHTHSVAEVGARRSHGGTVCQNCGLWEDELSPVELRGEGEAKEYGGIRFGPAVGVGRVGVGSCCVDCVREMTCAGCNSFFCPSCTFTPPPPGGTNPLAAEPPGPNHLKWTCPQRRHGPFCRDCADGEGRSHMTCIDCHGSICYGCHGPAGTTVSSSLYTPRGWTAEQERERFGVVGDIGGWEIGAYRGWGGEGEGDDGGGQMEAEAEAGGMNPPEPGPEAEAGYAGVMDAVLASLDTRPRPPPPPPPQELDLDADAGLPEGYGDPFRRLCETRIWEECARCGVGACAGCLGYEEDYRLPGEEDGQHPYVLEPEYRSCSGGCGRRFCCACLARPGGELVCAARWRTGGGEKTCGAVLCGACQLVEIVRRPTVWLGVEGGAEGEEEEERERDDEAGVWVCARCEIGVRPA